MSDRFWLGQFVFVVLHGLVRHVNPERQRPVVSRCDQQVFSILAAGLWMTEMQGERLAILVGYDLMVRKAGAFLGVQV